MTTIPIFTFYAAANDIASGTINLQTDTFYAHLITAAPTYQDTLVSQLPLASYTNYSSIPVVNNSYVNDIWKMDDLLFPVNLGSLQSIHGVVICRRQGALPSPTDQPVVFMRSREGNTRVDYPLDTNQRIMFRVDQVNGILTSVDRYFFSAGALVLPFDTNGIIYKLGTRNELQPFTNPQTGPYLRVRNFSNSSQTNPENPNPTNQQLDLTSRANNSPSSSAYLNVGNSSSVILNFSSNLAIRLKNFTFCVNVAGGNGPTSDLEILGSQYLLPGNLIGDVSQYISLGAFTFPPTTVGTLVNRIATLPGSDLFFRYILIRSSNSGDLRLYEVEFYGPEVTVASLTNDLS
jgi:hypothetical protein